MKNFLIESDEEELDDNGYEQQTRSQRRSKSVGRIEDSSRLFEPKFVHQYPKEGNFRFPLIPDEKEKRKYTYQPKSQKKKVQRETYKKSNSEPNNHDRQPREKFTGVNFKPSEIPSPVYGFQKRPEVFPPVSDEEVEEPNAVNTQNDDPTNTLDPFPTLLTESYDDKQEEPVEQEHNEGNNGQFDTAEIDVVHEEHREDEEERCYKERAIIHKESSPYELSSHYEEQSNGEKPSKEQSYVDETHSKEEAPPPSSRLEQDTYSKVTKSIKDEEEKVTNIQGEEQKTASNRRVERNLDEKEKKKSLLPFNVMMLQKDRKRTAPVNNPQPKQTHTTQEQHYQFPTTSLLDAKEVQEDNDELWLHEQKELLQSTLTNFNVKANVIGATKGPSVTRIEVQPAPGVKVNKITNLSDDIKLSLAAKDIRMEAPIPGRNAIGIEVPNKVSKPVSLREIVTHPIFKENHSTLSVALGLDISGKPVITDLQKMPHGLIAGATGSGKSVCINSLLISILFKAHPDDVRLLLIDPKMVELAPYNSLPHLVTPVITDAKEATLGLKWAVEEMERRYELFATTGVRDMERYNKLVKEKGTLDQKLPYIVVVIDELADLMMVSPQDVEDAICRIAQKARACGIHLLLATQRPSVDVITGLIKSNIPTRVAFAVSSQVDSRTIIDTGGAEKLLGRGDMLLLGNGVSKPVRIQGNFVSDDEIERITEHVKRQKAPSYLFEKEELVQSNLTFEQDDELFDEACEFVLEQGAASSSALQRRFRVGFNRAARLIDMMESKGIVSEAMGSKPRNVLVSKQEFYNQADEEITY